MKKESTLLVRCKSLVKSVIRPDRELNEVASIIRRMSRLPNRSALQIDCDHLFVDRLERMPYALKTNFWENHFEWKEVMLYPEICGNVFDFGCGTGHLDIMLARQGHNVFGADGSPIGIAIANRARAQEPVEVQSRLCFANLDVLEPNRTGKLFDSGISLHVFEHLEDPGPVLTGIRQFIKPNGNFLISVPFEKAYDDPDHVNYFYSKEELHDFLCPYIDVVRVDLSRETTVLKALCRV